MPRNPMHRARFWRAKRDATAIAVAGDNATPVALDPLAPTPARVEMPAPANANPANANPAAAVFAALPDPSPQPAPQASPALVTDLRLGAAMQVPATAAAAKPKGKGAGRARAAATGPVDYRDRHGRGLPNLTDLADRYGSDKGSAKHRYTELYNMLFQPFRNAPIRFLEMGLQIGGPELGHSEDRATTDLPSVRMWLEFFTQAQIFGLDVSDFDWFSHERFAFVRCDMDARANIAAAAAALPPMDIMIDDASHASHHQQFAFLELFPRLNDGGLYIVEDLRWQPEPYERKGITKTADLFQSYIQTGVFSHSDPETAAAFNALRLDISGCFLHQVHYNKSRRDQVLVVHKR